MTDPFSEFDDPLEKQRDLEQLMTLQYGSQQYQQYPQYSYSSQTSTSQGGQAVATASTSAYPGQYSYASQT